MEIAHGHRGVGKPDGSATDGWYAYTCGHCGRDVSGYVIAIATQANGYPAVRWLQCPTCKLGSVEIFGTGILPGIKFGPALSGLPDDVARAYDEARQCLGVAATTASEGMCRKILMHIAVDKGAAEGKTFAEYLEYLESQGYVTPPMRGWVRLIREHGNISQHRLPASDRRRAEGTLLFTAQLLRIVYEMEHLAQAFLSEPSKPEA